MIVQSCIVLETRGILTPDVFESLAQRVRHTLNVVKIYDEGCLTLNEQVRRALGKSFLPAISCAASLAHHGLLGSMQRMVLRDVDLTSVPAEHLASLASSVTFSVCIQNVSGCDLITILDSVKSRLLSIRSQSLDSEETQALVRAMDSRVEEVWLYEEVTLDIRELMEYNGQGKCRRVDCYCDTRDRYREQLRTWATSRNWEVTCDNDLAFYIDRLLEI